MWVQSAKIRNLILISPLKNYKGGTYSLVFPLMHYQHPGTETTLSVINIVDRNHFVPNFFITIVGFVVFSLVVWFQQLSCDQ